MRKPGDDWPGFRLYLASQSPRRHSLLRDLGIPFMVVPSTAKESHEAGDPETVALRNAVAKVQGAHVPGDAVSFVPAGAGAAVATGAAARSAAGRFFVLGTDTIVTREGRVLGKPSSAAEAAEMLRLLSGARHEVISGVALELREAGACAALRSACGRTEVTFLPLSDGDIEAYIASGEWRGKAGGYAVQGLAALFVDTIQGEYSNVVGLPLCLLARLFGDLGFDLLQRRWL
jgi:septum formation protein